MGDQYVEQLSARTRELMTERRMSWNEAWQAAEQEWCVATGLPPTSTHRNKGSKWLRLATIGVAMVFVATLVLILGAAILEMALGPRGEPAPVPLRILMWGIIIVIYVGIALVPVGLIGWLVTALVTADNWLDRFLPLIRAGAVVTLGALFLAFVAAFSTQDGTDIEAKEDAFFFLLWVAAAGFAVALIASLGYAGVWIYRRSPAQSPNLSD